MQLLFTSTKSINEFEMASETHKALAKYLKDVHSSLRKASNELGAQQAWQDHCKNKDVLKTYAHCMEKLATKHWFDESSESSDTRSRIKWAADLCHSYFIQKTYTKYRDKEIDIARKNNMTVTMDESFSEPIRLIDVGSCYNPFKDFDFIDVIAIDLCPANNTVYECDFLKVPVGLDMKSDKQKMHQLQHNFFEAVTFCFLLEYIPTSELRIIACEKAYQILKPGGLLIISTPDSKHVGANSKIMKCWQYTLALIGFTRIKYEKLKHMHCMAFRKALQKDTAVRWAVLHRETYMSPSINIPQDYQNSKEQYCPPTKIEVSTEDFNELPFHDS